MIYLVEDDESIRELVVYTLKSQGMDAKGFERPSLFWKELEKEVPALILLDIMLPEEDGISILRKLRTRPDTRKIPVIMLTAKGTEYDVVMALDSGADDYITKPFRPLVLGAKAKALIRRNKNLVLDNSDTLECGPFSYDTTTMRFYKNGEELILSSKESALLLLFMKHPQQVFTKDMIYEHVWGNTVAVDDNAIMVYINRLRGKIEDDRQNPAYILTIRGLGYRFVP